MSNAHKRWHRLWLVEVWTWAWFGNKNCLKGTTQWEHYLSWLYIQASPDFRFRLALFKSSLCHSSANHSVQWLIDNSCSEGLKKNCSYIILVLQRHIPTVRPHHNYCTTHISHVKGLYRSPFKTGLCVLELFGFAINNVLDFITYQITTRLTQRECYLLLFTLYAED